MWYTWNHTVAHIHVPHIYSYLYPVTVPVCTRGTRTTYIQHVRHFKRSQISPPPTFQPVYETTQQRCESTPPPYFASSSLPLSCCFLFLSSIWLLLLFSLSSIGKSFSLNQSPILILGLACSFNNTEPFSKVCPALANWCVSNQPVEGLTSCNQLK